MVDSFIDGGDFSASAMVKYTNLNFLANLWYYTDQTVY